MSRIGLRNLLATGAVVLMFATGATANTITLTAVLTGAQETPPIRPQGWAPQCSSWMMSP